MAVVMAAVGPSPAATAHHCQLRAAPFQQMGLPGLLPEQGQGHPAAPGHPQQSQQIWWTTEADR
jgi:hypothetical protein